MTATDTGRQEVTYRNARTGETRTLVHYVAAFGRHAVYEAAPGRRPMDGPNGHYTHVTEARKFWAFLADQLKAEGFVRV